MPKNLVIASKYVSMRWGSYTGRDVLQDIVMTMLLPLLLAEAPSHERQIAEVLHAYIPVLPCSGQVQRCVMSRLSAKFLEMAAL